MSTDVVSLTEAARRLTELGDAVERSTLSRYVQKHADALFPQRQGKQTVIDFGRLRLHRQQNIRLDQSAPEPRAPPGYGQPSRNDAQARNQIAQAQMRELDLAERKKELVPVNEVQEAAREAITRMRTSFDLAVNEAAEQIAANFGGEARIARPHLKAMIRSGLDRFARDMTELAEPPPEGPDNGSA